MALLKKEMELVQEKKHDEAVDTGQLCSGTVDVV